VCSASPVTSADYCLLESFEPSCPPGSVILMLTASYGRMRVGRCLSRDYYIGCSADVIGQMDRRCSGKDKCRVSVPEPTLVKVTPCPKDLVAYLEADYACVKGACAWKNRCFQGRTDETHLHGGPKNWHTCTFCTP